MVFTLIVLPYNCWCNSISSSSSTDTRHQRFHWFTWTWQMTLVKAQSGWVATFDNMRNTRGLHSKLELAIGGTEWDPAECYNQWSSIQGHQKKYGCQIWPFRSKNEKSVKKKTKNTNQNTVTTKSPRWSLAWTPQNILLWPCQPTRVDSWPKLWHYILKCLVESPQALLQLGVITGKKPVFQNANQLFSSL